MKYQITFCGLNIAKTLCVFCKQNVQVLHCDLSQKVCTIVVECSQYKQVVALLEQRCYNIVKVQKIGKGALWDYCKKHFILGIFLILLVFAMVVLQNYCLKIVVTGDFDSQQVLDNLQSLGISKGKNIKTVNVDNVENALANNMDAMYAVISKKSSVVYVNVVAKKIVDTPIDMHKRRDIVATCDGVVTAIVCEQGTPKVCVGQSVKAGDVLIEGIRLFNDQTQTDVYALGKVTLQLCTTGFAPYTGYVTQSIPTGKSQTVTRVTLFGKSYGKKCDYANYISSQKDSFLYPLNLKVSKITYYQMVDAQMPITLAENLPTLTQQALLEGYKNCNYTVTNTQFITTSKGVTAYLYGSVQIQ